MCHMAVERNEVEGVMTKNSIAGPIAAGCSSSCPFDRLDLHRTARYGICIFGKVKRIHVLIENDRNVSSSVTGSSRLRVTPRKIMFEWGLRLGPHWWKLVILTNSKVCHTSQLGLGPKVPSLLGFGTEAFGKRHFQSNLQLPSTLKSLTLDQDFNQPLEQISLPEGLKSLRFTSIKMHKTVQQNSLVFLVGWICMDLLLCILLLWRIPLCQSHLRFGCEFNKSLEQVSFPNSSYVAPKSCCFSKSSICAVQVWRNWLLGIASTSHWTV